MAFATSMDDRRLLTMLQHLTAKGMMLALVAPLVSGIAAAQDTMSTSSERSAPGSSAASRSGDPTAPGSFAGSGADAPVIAAPNDPGRAEPAMGQAFAPPETATFNAFAASDVPPPPMDSYDFAPPALPVVVELFTSQGCSSCPPADAMLAQIANEPGVLALSYHVDYWDYLGWADSFAKPEFTERQELYARASGERSVYTPQLIVDGQDTAVAPGPSQLMGLIDANRMSPAMVSVRRETTEAGETIELMPLSDLGGRVDIMLIRYAPERRVEVTAGENRGRVVTYTNVVLAMDQLAEWDGARPLRMNVKPDGIADDSMPADTRHVVLVQQDSAGSDQPGPILAAIQLD